MAVQFSRGCPYDCEFCDIIVMNGRVPRTKTPAQLIGELEALRLRGWKDMVFIVDDNFIGDNNRTKTFLRELIAWRDRTRPGMGFFTEASVNLADDAELCELMVKAGFKKVFVGLETPSAESLQECHKVQNKGRDLVETVKTLQRAGLEVMGGFIVGFDSDRQDIFKQQFEFIQRSGVVTAMVGLLSALPQTRLYQRLKKEGRLVADSTGNNTEAVLNFRLSRPDEETLRAEGLLSANPHLPETVPAERPAAAAFTRRFPGLREIFLAPGNLGPRPPQLLAVLLGHAAAPAWPAPLRHRTGGHWLPLPPRRQPALTWRLRGANRRVNVRRSNSGRAVSPRRPDLTARGRYGETSLPCLVGNASLMQPWPMQTAKFMRDLGQGNR
jgi:hypothetical protein